MRHEGPVQEAIRVIYKAVYDVDGGLAHGA